MRFNFGWSITDGKLDFETGRIVIFQDKILKSNSPTNDHNDLLRALAAKYKLPKDQVISNAHRFYWKPGNGGIVISPVRKLDEDWVYENVQLFKSLIDKEFDK
jgi:hypothetical protein